MQTAISAFRAVFPLLAYMVLGKTVSVAGLLSDEVSQGITKLVFNVFLPVNIALSIMGTDLGNMFDVRIVLFVAVSCVAGYFLITMVVRRFNRDPKESPVIIQAIHKSNYGLLCIPIISSFYGDEIGMSAVLIAVIVPIVNICSTHAFMSASGRKTGMTEMLKKIIVNPLVLASVTGVVLGLLGVKLPALIEDGFLKELSGMATPLAMISLGADLHPSKALRAPGKLIWSCVGKLIIYPMLIVPIAAFALGIRGADLIAILIYSGGPTAVNAYSTAVSMGGDRELAGETVAVSSLFSVLTMFLWLCGLGSLGLI